jgi:hypothetical protein
VQLDSGADLLALKELDQKLWVALSCPTRGIEFDTNTLDLIDNDADGHVRANEVLAAIAWAGGLLKNAELLVKGSDSLALADIDDSSTEGKQVLASARHILKSLGKSAATGVSLADMADIENSWQVEFNGDGVICAGRIADAGLRATVEDIIKCAGSVADLSSEAGVNREIADRFLRGRRLCGCASQNSDAAILLLGEDHGGGGGFHAVKDKASDYFTRCQLAAYDARAAVPLSRSAEDYQRLAAQNLSAQSQDVAGFAGDGWRAGKRCHWFPASTRPRKASWMHARAVEAAARATESLSAQDWAALCAGLRHSMRQAENRPAVPSSSASPRIREILGNGHRAALDGLMAQDKAVEVEVRATAWWKSCCAITATCSVW